MDRLASLEDASIRLRLQETYNSTLGSYAVLLTLVLYVLLPSVWQIVSFQWSASWTWSFLALVGHGLFYLSIVVALRCAQVQTQTFLETFYKQYMASKDTAVSAPTDVSDPRAALDEVMKLQSLRSHAASGSTTTALSTPTQRSFFDDAEPQTFEDGKAYLRRLQLERQQKETEESLRSSAAYSAPPSLSTEGYSMFGAAGMLQRVYQATGFDPYARDLELPVAEEDALQTSSHPHVAWKQLEEWGLHLFMHIYCRNVRRLLAYHLKDVVQAFLQNTNELVECGVLADVLLRRQPSQALLCPPGESQQLSNVSLSDMLHGLTKSPSFYSKSRGVYLFEEHRSFEKYLNVGDIASSEVSSLERQEYVLERLMMLSRDRNLDRFRWDKGANWKGKEWTEALPTDAEIVMNVFCCLLDNVLPADNERDRPFWKHYFLSTGPRRPFTPKMRNRIYLVKTVHRSPHFKVLVRSSVREIVPGAENCFHALVVYLHAVKKMKAGHLDSINLHRITDLVFDVAK